ASVLDNLGTIYRLREHHAEAESTYLEALKAREALAAERPEDVNVLLKLATTRNNLAGLYTAAGKLDKAEKAYAEGCGLLEQLSHEHPEVPTVAIGLATGYQGRAELALRRDLPADAHAWLTKAIAIREELLKKDADDEAVGGQLHEAYRMRA